MRVPHFIRIITERLLFLRRSNISHSQAVDPMRSFWTMQSSLD
jgi:hypothetical protein